MSPASSGALEVERYIGACLISSQGRPKNRGQDHPQLVHDVYAGGGYVNLHQQRCGVDGWAGGMPLISFMSQRRRRPDQTDDQQKTLSRLAIHTQGAPLILSGRYNHRKTKEPRNGQGGGPGRAPDCSRGASKFGGGGRSVARNSLHHVRVSDSISVASDESSGSGNSENCLPRIIKPRKRRKKDRKPPHLARVDSASLSSASNSPEIEPYRDEPVYFCDFVQAAANVNAETIVKSDDAKGARDTGVHKGEEAPKLHHSFEEVEGSDDVAPAGADTSSCQCRYCDPSGQIWDVDRRCYSPFLTLPSLSNYHLFSFNLTPECLADRMSNISLSGAAPRSPLVQQQGDLEVSTEIVTSLNGHRDLEIKFFSTPASATEASSSLTSTTLRATPTRESGVAESGNKQCAGFGAEDSVNVFLSVEE